jgi:hypothetical protein
MTDNKKCAGYLYTKKDCYKNAIKNEIYCEGHLYFNDFSNTIIDKIRNGSTEYKPCSRCKKWFSGDKANCKICIDQLIQIRKNKMQNAKKCSGLDCDGNKCRNNSLQNGFCKFHDYMEKYTKEMMNNLTLCSGCKKQYYKPNSATCDKCKNRGKKIREVIKDKIIFCKYEGCDNKMNDKFKNDYCGKHQREAFKEKIEKKGMKVCKNYIRGCNEELEIDYSFSRCSTCLLNERTKDRLNRIKQHEKAQQIINKVDTNKVENSDEIDDDNFDDILLMCVSCPKSNNMHNMNEFIKRNIDRCFIGFSKRCNGCRKYDREHDKRDRKRDFKNSNYTKEQLEKQYNRKKEWRINNKKRCNTYVKKYKLKIREKIGEKVYLANMAKWSKEYRDSHPEIMKMMYDNKKKNSDTKFKVYIRSARIRNIKFEIDFDFCKKLFTGECYYCKQKYIEGGHLIGIDRVDNKIGYIETNCVSCCKICNFIKCTMDKEILYEKIKHIMSYIKLSSNLYINNDVFKDSSSTSYESHLKRLNDKKFDTDFDIEYYYKLKNHNCYICGKESHQYHINGIDRIDSKIGYLKNNSLPCCTDCNYMKKNYEFSEFIYKLYNIYVSNNEIQTNILSQDTVTYICKLHIREEFNKIKNDMKLSTNELKHILNNNDIFNINKLNLK